MKSLKSLLNESIPNDELSVNLQKVVKIIEIRKIGKIIATLIASFLVPFNALYANFFTFYHTDSSVVENVHTAFAAELSVTLNNFLADFFTSFAIRSLVLILVLCLLIPLIVSGLILLLFFVISNTVFDKKITSSSKSLRDGFKAVNELINDGGNKLLLSIVRIVLSAIICIVYSFFFFKDWLSMTDAIIEKIILAILIILIIVVFIALCIMFCLIATIPAKHIKVNAGISKYDFDKLWLQKDPIEKKEREEARKRRLKKIEEDEKRKLEEERKYRATHAKIKVHFRCSRSDYRAIVKDNGTFLFNLKPGQTKTADVPVGEHYITSQVVDDYEGGRGNVNGGSVYLGPGEIQELEVTA